MLIHTDGLCSNCRFSAECTLSKDPLNNTLFCEEYRVADASQENRNHLSTRDAKLGKSGSNSSADNASHKVLGLCSNCIHKKSCSFEKPESGVWHCEEYA